MTSSFDKKSRAGASLIAALLLAIVPHRAAGQPGPPESPSNIECLEHLEIPEYPPLARQARIQVTETVKVLLSDQATVQNIEHSLQWKAVNSLQGKAVNNIETLFKEGAENALRNSRFSKTCGGKTIMLVFQYEIRDDPNRSSLFAFGTPNHFWIRYGPIYVNPEVSVK